MNIMILSGHSVKQLRILPIKIQKLQKQKTWAVLITTYMAQSSTQVTWVCLFVPW